MEAAKTHAMEGLESKVRPHVTVTPESRCSVPRHALTRTPPVRSDCPLPPRQCRGPTPPPASRLPPPAPSQASAAILELEERHATDVEAAKREAAGRSFFTWALPALQAIRRPQR